MAKRNRMKKIISALVRIKNFFKDKYNKYTILSYITLSLVLNFVIEMLGRSGSFLEALYHLVGSPYVFICNSLIILMTLSITLLARRRVFFITIISMVWLIFGIANCVLLSYRVTPFSMTDMIQIENAFGVMNKYLNTFQVILIIVLLVAAIAALVFIWIKVPKVGHKINYPRNILGIAIIILIGAGGLSLGVSSGVLATNFGNLADAYHDYGFVYCFSNSVVNTGVSKPSDYSDETIEELTSSLESLEEESGDDESEASTPNIIMLQLESFFDVKAMENLTFSEDPVPTFTALKENYTSGYLSVPVIGAGTVNTEFEILTGMNLDDFGPGEYPFKTILKDTSTESFAFNLKDYGYTSTVIHNHTATFYSRNVVYANLGFDRIDSIEFMHVDDFTDMEWAKDYFLTDEIMTTLSLSEGSDFIYTISVQGHGSYPTSGEYDTTIEVEGCESESVKNAMEYYCTQINEMDAFIAELIEELSDFDEDIILVLYGDHLPSLGISESDLSNGDIYQTEYVIWTNFDIEYEDEDIEAYELQAKILSKLGITDGVINAYNQTNRLSDETEEYLSGLQNLEYDLLYGDMIAWGYENPYSATQIEYGLQEITMTGIEHVDYETYLNLMEENEDSQDELSDESMDADELIASETDPDPEQEEDDVILVYGSNFTSYSKVYINDEKQTTTYIDEHTLKINYELEDGDLIYVWQQNSDSHQLSRTDDYIYSSSGGDGESETQETAKQDDEPEAGQ